LVNRLILVGALAPFEPSDGFFLAADPGGEGVEASAELVDFDGEAGEGECFAAAEAVLFDADA
jgi:hypothetical protein